MYRFRSGIVFATLLSTVLLGACVTNPTESERSEMQRAALQSWKACLTRNTDATTLPAMQLTRLVKQDCEGHKRDVIAVFPKHLASQVDALLVSNAYRHISTVQKSNSDPDQAAQAVHTLLR